MYIYKTTNIVTGKIYVGQTKKLSHKSKSYLGSGSDFLEAVKEFGKHNFTKEILKDDIKTQTLLDAWEIIFIAKFNANDKNIGYNNLKGPAKGFKGQNPMYVEELKIKAKNGRDKFWNSEDGLIMREKVGEWAKLANKGDKNPMFGIERDMKAIGATFEGRNHTEETKLIQKQKSSQYRHS